MTVSAINTFRLRPGVPVADFEQFSAELDRPVCLAFDEVLGFDVYLSDDGVVVEVMTVTSWPDWEQVRDNAPELKPVVAEALPAYHEALAGFRFDKALEAAWKIVGAVNRYIEGQAPWALAKSSQDAAQAKLRNVLIHCH